MYVHTNIHYDIKQLLTVLSLPTNKKIGLNLLLLVSCRCFYGIFSSIFFNNYDKAY